MAERNLASLYVSWSESVRELEKTAYKGDGNSYVEGALDTLRDVLAALDRLDEPAGIAEMIDEAKRKVKPENER